MRTLLFVFLLLLVSCGDNLAGPDRLTDTDTSTDARERKQSFQEMSAFVTECFTQVQAQSWCSCLVDQFSYDFTAAQIKQAGGFPKFVADNLERYETHIARCDDFAPDPE